jgi:hypothetical protein
MVLLLPSWLYLVPVVVVRPPGYYLVHFRIRGSPVQNPLTQFWSWSGHFDWILAVLMTLNTGSARWFALVAATSRAMSTGDPTYVEKKQ